MMWTARLVPMAAAAILLPVPGHAQGQPTDEMIRQRAGLPASSARGDIELLDIGHHALDTMISIVARHDARGWHVSYACAASPGCAHGQDHDAKAYDLSAEASSRVDDILRGLKDPSIPAETPDQLCVGAQFTLRVRLVGSVRVFHRTCNWTAPFDELEQLLRPPPAKPGDGDTGRL